MVTQPRWTGSSDDRKDYDKPVAAAGFAICLGCLLVIGGVWCGIASLTFAGEFFLYKDGLSSTIGGNCEAT